MTTTSSLIERKGELMRPRPTPLEKAAYHEAGHVVMGFLVRGPSLDRVWITEEGNGKAESSDWWPVNLDTLKQGDFSEEAKERICQNLEGTIKILLAGPIAELRFLRKKIPAALGNQNISVREDGESDLQKVGRIIRGITHARRGGAQGTDFENEFFQYLIQEEVKKIFRKPKVWPTVTTLANALIQHKKLAGKAAWKICEKCGLTWGSEIST